MCKIKEIIKLCEINNRICPQPQKWNELWGLLKNKKRAGNSWEPPLPLILAAWHCTSDYLKKERFIEHISWAEKENQLNEILDFLTRLNESDWHHDYK
jgi:hypothetical protein